MIDPDDTFAKSDDDNELFRLNRKKKKRRRKRDIQEPTDFRPIGYEW